MYIYMYCIYNICYIYLYIYICIYIYILYMHIFVGNGQLSLPPKTFNSWDSKGNTLKCDIKEKTRLSSKYPRTSQNQM